MTTQAELDLDGVRAKADAVEAAFAKALDHKGTSLDSAVIDAVRNAIDDLKNQVAEVKVQYLDNATPGSLDAEGTLNNAPGTNPAAKAADKK